MEKRGLTEKEAEKRLQTYGFNEIKESLVISPIKILFRQIKKNFILYLLFIAVILSFIVGKSITAYTILVVIFVLIFTGFIQEYRAEKAIKSLRGMLMPISIVIRDGKEKEILSKDIVPGDIILLRNGEKIPADCIVIEEKELPLQNKVNRISKYMAIVAIVFSILTGLFMIMFNPPSENLLIDALILMIALAVSAFPEGFPVVLITALANGVYKMAQKNAIVNRMSIIETLGETTVICSDKTGTITKGEMSVSKIYAD